MDLEKDKITVRYQIKKEQCSCCGKELDEPEIGDVREFDFYLQDIHENEDWSSCEKEELEDEVYEYVYRTVRFYAVSGEDSITFLEGEVGKISDYIKTILVK